MKCTFFIFGFLFFAFFLNAQQYKKIENETSEAFINRIKPEDAVVVHKVLETKIWNAKDTTKAILAFFETKQCDSAKGECQVFIDMVMYFPEDNNNFKAHPIGNILEDGGLPEIKSVFYANANKDSLKELCVLVVFPQHHYDYNGYFYNTFIYGFPYNIKNQEKLDNLKNRFFGCDCTTRAGKKRTAKYTSANAIKAALKKMGY